MKKIWYSLFVVGALAFGIVFGASANVETISASGTETDTPAGFPIQPPV